VKYKAVLFDLDGTLLNTIEDLTDSMNSALARMGYPPRTVAECKDLVGDGLELFVRKALPSAVRDDPRAAEKLKQFMREEYRVRKAIKTKPYQGIPELLDALTARAIPMAVLSNKPHDSTLAVMDAFFGRWKFGAVFGARDGVPVKPHPAVALEIAGILRVRPEEIVYLGDTNTDMQTATAAGMWPVAALWGFRTAEELTANGAKVLLEKPPDLLSLFG
jgi:phosphoglycolate phosphatase